MDDQYTKLTIDCSEKRRGPAEEKLISFGYLMANDGKKEWQEE